MPRAVRFAPALALTGLIFYLSAQPDLSSGIEGWDFVLRKLGHMTVFGTLFLALWWAMPRQPVASAAITVLYAVSDEWHQSFTAGRHGTPVDVLIDATGVLIAYVLYMRFTRRPRTQP
ncbi:MAG: VanZ family protein [Solirubrobacteraceae bacterium]|nr:VanZ family protein [Solirubrobacteraceae bacterium]